jgi:mRNA interferase YafQ
MRSVKWASAFKKDLKRESRGQYKNALKEEFYGIVAALANDSPLLGRYKDHDLEGEWVGYRECHIRPDFLLVYRKTGSDVLGLSRLGSHSEIFGK